MTHIKYQKLISSGQGPWYKISAALQVMKLIIAVLASIQ